MTTRYIVIYFEDRYEARMQTDSDGKGPLDVECVERVEYSVIFRGQLRSEGQIGDLLNEIEGWNGGGRVDFSHLKNLNSGGV